MKIITQLSIYIIYLIIAIISILVSYKTSIIMALVVVAIEYIRLLAIYNRIYSVIVIVFIMNVGLISYSSYQSYKLTSLKNNQIIEKNNIAADYLKTNSLKASTFQNIKADIQEIKEVTIDYWLIIGIYLFLELALIMLIIGVNQKYKRELKQVKPIKQASKSKIKVLPKVINKVEELKDDLKEVGSYLEYAKKEGISRGKAQKLFSLWKKEEKLTKLNGKNYLRN
ncbi:hypothetical protein ABSA28_01177 [Candidatus Hepatincolaceae symbiont of Richtersius coronifer]